MNKPAILLISLILSAVLLLSSCQPAATPAGGQKSIVVTYSILGSVVKALVGDQASVTVSIPNGLDPHEWEPSARDIEIINRADLVIENGLGIEGGMGKALEGARQKRIRFFTASDYVTIRTVGIDEGIPSHDPGGLAGMPDPHFWLDPLAMKPIVTALSERMRKDFNIDVNERARDMGGRLDTLDADINRMVAAVSVENRKLVTGHESMGYFAARYDFKLIGVIIPGLTTQAEVSAADLAALKKAIATSGVKAIFTELGTPAAVASVIGRETGVKVIPLNTHLLPPDGSYFTFMRNLATAVTAALQ